MRFSLVVPTLDRVKELGDFLEGLMAQSVRDFEVIIIDQSGRDIFEDVIARYRPHFSVHHLRSDVRKPRHACNLGSKTAQGDIIAFPDDDCIYQPDTLARIDRFFRDNAGPRFLTGAVLNLDGKPSAMGSWLEHSQILTTKSVWRGLIEFNFFMYRKDYEAVGGFDDETGPGTRFGSSEGQDLALRLMAQGVVGYHDRDLLVRHMDKASTTNASRAQAYGLGMGYVMRKNAISPPLALKMMVRSLGGLGLSLLKRRSDLVHYYWGTLQGRACGYFSKSAARAARQQGALRSVNGSVV